MSVISNVTVTPNRIAIVYRFLRTCNDMPIAEKDLKEILAPQGLRAQGTSNIADEVVREARHLGIIEMDEPRNCRLAPELRGFSENDFLGWLEGVLLDPSKAESANQASFPLALAWFLDQDPAKPFDFGDNIKDLITAQCGPEAGAFEMSNRSRSQNFVYWAQYLGYAWRLKVGNAERVIPDPTRALERHLPRLLAEQGELTVTDLLRAWSSSCPVLEGGLARHRVGELRSGYHRDPKALSRSTSIALLRLWDRKLIKLDRRADALSYALDVQHSPKPISHVILNRVR